MPGRHNLFQEKTARMHAMELGSQWAVLGSTYTYRYIFYTLR